MDEQVDTATFVYNPLLNRRIDTVNTRIDTLSRDLHGRIDAVYRRLDTLIVGQPIQANPPGT